MNKLIQISIVLLLAGTNCLAAGNSPETIKIGIITSLSDEWAAIGENIIRGAELARDEVNAASGAAVRIEFLVEDSVEANSGARAVTAYRSLRQRGIEFFLGPTGTSAAMSLAPIVSKEPVVMITPAAGVRSFSEAGVNLFNARGADESASRETAKYAFNQGWKTAAVLSSQQPWESIQGNAFSDQFKLAGGTIAGLEEPPSDANDLRVPIAKILKAKPQVIFLSNMNRAALAGKQLSELGYTGPRLAALLDDSIVKAADGTLEHAIFANFSGATEAFAEKYKRKYGGAPNFGADTAYDAILAFAEALRKSADKSPPAVANALQSVSFEGAGGKVSFDTGRVAIRSLTRYVVKNGAIEIKTR